MTNGNDRKLITFGGDPWTGIASMFIHHMTGHPPTDYIPIKVDYQYEEYFINGETVRMIYNDHEGGGEE